MTPTLKRTEKEKNDWKCKTSRGERLKVNMAFCGVLIAVCRTCIPMLVLLAQWEDVFHVLYLRAIRVFTTLKTLKSNQWIFYHHECADTIVCELVKCHERNSSLTGGFESPILKTLTTEGKLTRYGIGVQFIILRRATAINDKTASCNLFPFVSNTWSQSHFPNL